MLEAALSARSLLAKAQTGDMAEVTLSSVGQRFLEQHLSRIFPWTSSFATGTDKEMAPDQGPTIRAFSLVVLL